MPNILIINGNPKQKSLCRSLTESYLQGVVESCASAKVFHISDMDFDENLREGYDKIQTLEGDLLKIQLALLEAQHIVIISPVWWGVLPAKLKGLFDRVFLPGFAFKFIKGKLLPKRLMHGKTSRIIVTMDSPVWWYRFIIGDSIVKTLRRSILEFCGIKVKNVSRFGPVKDATDIIRMKWLSMVKNAGKQDTLVFSKKDK